MNILKKLFKKTPDPTIEAKAILAGEEGLAEKVRPLVLDYMLAHTNDDWDVHFILCRLETRVGSPDPCVVVEIYCPTPGKVIGAGGETARALSSFIGAKLREPVYTKGVKFNPFKDSLPC
jgi:hypothetical protein